MHIRFSIIGASQKRWHGKVAKAAADRLSSVLHSAACSIDGPLCAEFATDEAVVVVVRREKRLPEIYTVVRFAAMSWGDMPSSIADATQQLASVVTSLMLPDRESIRMALIAASVSFERPVRIIPVDIPRDPRSHFVIYFDDPSISLEELHRFDDLLDERLRKHAYGEVDGSGYGLGGAHLDLSLRDANRGVTEIRAFLSDNNLLRVTRIEKTEA